MPTRPNDNRDDSDQQDEPQRVVTVRMTQSLHEAIREESYHLRISMNEYCCRKLKGATDAERSFRTQQAADVAD